MPVSNITASGPTTFVQGGNVVLTASAGASYKWFKGTTQVGTASSYTASTAGVYTLEVTNTSSCKATSVGMTVNVNSNQPSVITLTAPTNNATINGAITISATATDPDGAITKVEGGSIRIWDGDYPSSPVADLQLTQGTLDVVPISPFETFCGGTARVPNIYGMPINEARSLLEDERWTPLPKESGG